jgi:N-acetylneuraminic acid mutarotase
VNRRAAGIALVVGLLAAPGTPAAASAAERPGSTGAAAVASDGTWTSDTPSGFPRREVTYVAVGSTMYLAGGLSPIQQAFDAVTHTWSTVAPLPESLDHIGAVALNGKVYYVGGLDGYPGPSFGNVYVYDPATNTVTSAAPLPSGRDRGAAGIAVYQDRIYLAGGFHAGASVAFFDMYDPATNAWTSLPDLPERRDHVSAAVVGGRMYVIGGRTFGKGPQPQNDAYDFVAGKWVTGLAPLPTLRAGAATAVFGSEIAVIGGEGFGGTFNQAEAYDTTTNTWRELTPMPTARHGIQAAMYNGSAYIADGGTKMGGGADTDVQQVLTLTTPPPSGRPDCRVRLLTDSALLGNNVYDATGAGQTRAVTTAARSTTFVFSLQNDGSSPDALVLSAPGSATALTAKYLLGLSGSTDITAAVVAGRYRTAALAPGAARPVRLQVTVAAGTAAGTTGTWLADVSSVSDPSAQDDCAARLTVR